MHLDAHDREALVDGGVIVEGAVDGGRRKST